MEIILQSSDEADIGQHEVELLIQLQDYPDIAKTVFFQVTVNPCIITDYSLDIVQTEFVYTVNDAALTTDAYSFTQTNACGYAETLIIDNPASFITHNEETSDFTIETSERSDAEIYKVMVSSSI